MPTFEILWRLSGTPSSAVDADSFELNANTGDYEFKNTDNGNETVASAPKEAVRLVKKKAE